MTEVAFNSVWEAIEDDPVVAENMKLRSTLMMAITEHIKSKGLNQTDAAKLFAVTQPRVSDLMRGKIELFSVDSLIAMLGTLGIGVDLKLKTARARSLGLAVRRSSPKVQTLVKIARKRSTA